MSSIINISRVFFGLCLLGALTYTSSNTADASSKTGDIADKIEADHKVFEKMLNEKSDPEALMLFLHESISNSAEIHLTINNPDMKGAEETEVKLSKADYINSYVYGPRQVENYRANIKTVQVNVDEENKAAWSKEIFTESGIMKNPMDYTDAGRDFSSRTVCNSEYGLNEQEAMVLQSIACRTDISYGQDV